jgi:hypothetical protein
MKTLYRTAAALLAVALLGVPCHAMTSNNQVAGNANLRQGVIVEQTGTALRINGKTYAFALASTPVYDRAGARIDAPRLAVGQTVIFSLAGAGAQARIKELWITQ